MNKEEYYKRLEKTTEKIKTDRCSEDEIANINRQKLYLAEHYISSLEQENQRLDKENRELKKQLEYLRSGEYYNQLRFENEMLQQVVDTNGVPSEVYDYIDCTHRNTELLEENQKYKEVIDKVNNKLSQYKNDLKEYQEQDIINHQNISIGLVGVKIRAFEDILKEVE